MKKIGKIDIDRYAYYIWLSFIYLFIYFGLGLIFILKVLLRKDVSINYFLLILVFSSIILMVVSMTLIFILVKFLVKFGLEKFKINIFLMFNTIDFILNIIFAIILVMLGLNNDLNSLIKTNTSIFTSDKLLNILFTMYYIPLKCIMLFIKYVKTNFIDNRLVERN